VCRIWRQGNCRISFCNNEDSESCDSNQEWGRRTNAIIDYCGPDAGGYQSAPEPKPWTEVAVRTNTDWFMAAGGPDAVMNAADGVGKVAYEELTVEENEAEVERMESLARQLSAQTNQLSARVRLIYQRKKGISIATGIAGGN
jgi:hypothetical protein